ncbi:glycosyltransferase family 2 protein [Shewanella xiamenensis]|uniref:glycosyltransferase family 2 protein n=1 Tax=Shewanella xiamenensis TaxID=332186 RepID=UPI001CC4C53C|nr:glycosyltransferase family 2 protein [Shewanella xiamenensis]BDA59924.1 glycosyl transferase [Shewanella xiamenensis]
MKNCIVSIITVTYNNKIGLSNTINSVNSQSFDACEHIIVDGKSSDGSLELLEGIRSDKKFLFVSEVDNGIFHAMNKGVELASGNWLLFLNAGDVFPTSSTLAKLFMTGTLDDTSLDLIYGDKLDSEGRIVKAKNDLSCLYYGEMPACHQSIFFRKNISYDESFKIFGDIDLMARIYLSQPSYRYVPMPISVFEGGGVSSKVSWTKRKEKFRSLLKNFGVYCVLKNYILNPCFYRKILFK